MPPKTIPAKIPALQTGAPENPQEVQGQSGQSPEKKNTASTGKTEEAADKAPSIPPGAALREAEQKLESEMKRSRSCYPHHALSATCHGFVCLSVQTRFGRITKLPLDDLLVDSSPLKAELLYQRAWDILSNVAAKNEQDNVRCFAPVPAW